MGDDRNFIVTLPFSGTLTVWVQGVADLTQAVEKAKRLATLTLETALEEDHAEIAIGECTEIVETNDMGEELTV